MSDDLDDFPEMTPGEGWVTWANSSDVDTGGYCDCGHEGLGVAWHTGDCRGASYALRNKVMELLAAAAERDATGPSAVLRRLSTFHAPLEENDMRDQQTREGGTHE